MNLNPSLPPPLPWGQGGGGGGGWGRTEMKKEVDRWTRNPITENKISHGTLVATYL